MSALKVYAYLAWAPNHWPITPSPNGGRQVRAVAQVPSRAAFVRLLAAAGVATSRSEHGNIRVTGNAAEMTAATSEPGVLFHATADMGRVYIKAVAR